MLLTRSRRKYRKIMVKFEEKMRESNTLFREEQRILDISRRLSEQNDQLLELLYDLNRCPQIPPQRRYDLRPQGAFPKKKQTTDTEEDLLVTYDSSTASAALRQARHELRSGDMTLSEYQRLADAILESPGFAPQKSFSSLSKMPTQHTVTNAEQDQDTNGFVPPATGFPSSHQEEQYLQGLDSYLTGSSETPRAFANGLAARNGDRSTERDRDMALRNPVSVYNWLRKHQPQVFLQDNEVHAEKPPRGSAFRSSKRASTSIKQEPELYDDDGIAMDMSLSARGKRKRDDDGGYRPKGGNSRPAKRKKDEGSTSSKKAKRPASAASTVT